MARIFRARVQQRILGQQMITAYSYRSASDVDPGLGSAALASALGYADTDGSIFDVSLWVRVAGAVVALQSLDTSYENLYIYAPYFPLGLFDKPFLGLSNGQNSTQTGAPFISQGFRSNRTRRDIRRGFKRIGGLPEDHFVTDGSRNANYDIPTNAAAKAFGDVQIGESAGVQVTFTPIVESLKVTFVDGKKRYVPWDTEAEALANVMDATDWVADDVSTTQNSRKRGRGA